MLKARSWAEAVKLAADGYEETRGTADALMSRAEVRFANGSRIVAIPANPATARGYSANLVLDEFAIHEKPQEIWAAIYPSITNPLSGEKRLRIVSTPKGRGNKFADLWEHNGSYSKHRVTIEDACRAGLKLDLAALRAGVDDPDVWAQEYMCEFIDSTAVLLPYDMIGLCESASIRDPGDAPLFIGMDVGRSHDLSVIVTGALLGDVLHVVSVDTLEKTPFAEQLAILRGKAAERRVRRVCIDATGIGSMLAEEARRECGAKVVPVVFTAAEKGGLYTRMRRAFEDRTVRVPVSRELREDLHAVQRTASSSGAVSYSAPRSADGHSDRAAALALCLRAAAARGEYVSPFSAGARRDYESREIYE